MTYGLKIENGDIVRTAYNSGYLYVTDSDKVKQDAAMILTSDTRTSTGLGCQLTEMVGSDSNNMYSTYSNAPVMFTFQARVRTGLERLKQAQRRFQFSQRTAQELIHEIAPVRIWPDRGDPRNFHWTVDILTVDGRANFTMNGRGNL